MSRAGMGNEMRVGRQTVEITRPQKLLFPDDGIDKRQLAEYYARIATTMLPYLRNRPVTMERYPDGIQGMRLIQKRAASYFPDWITTASMKKQDGTVRHVVCQDAATLVYLANQACITPHVWLSRVDKPDHPDQMIFDLDPSDGNFRTVCRAALRLRELLERERLTAFVKTTGSRPPCACPAESAGELRRGSGVHA
jgi:bifunctional non-homologous end joining protein LigD